MQAVSKCDLRAATRRASRSAMNVPTLGPFPGAVNRIRVPDRAPFLVTGAEGSTGSSSRE